jgi:rifampicin phosphotransferase
VPTEAPVHSDHCDPTSPDLHWTTNNLGEVMPGVQTPLSFTVWQVVMDWASHRNAYEVGVLPRRFGFPAPIESPLLRQFYGRIGFQVEYFVVFGDRMPGTTGPEVCRSILGGVPEDIEFHPTKRRYPVVALRYPYVFATNPRRVRTAATEQRAWYGRHLEALPVADLGAATSAFVEATERLQRAVSLQALTLLSSIQPLWQAIEAIVESTGVGDTGIFSGTGGAEANLVRDLWRASRGQLELEQVRTRHGFHGPVEGELSSRTWREDDAPLRDLIRRYASKPESSNPIALEEESARMRELVVAEALAKTPRLRRPVTRMALGLAAKRIPLRGVAKESFLEAFDGARAAARRIGSLLAEDGRLEAAEDVFFLRKDEITGALPADARKLVRERRELHEEYKRYAIPSEWKGTPEGELVHDGASPETDELTGVGVSDGVVEGIARVVMEPDFAEVEDGEILVSSFTDPGWASIMFISSALVVDIGGAMSHAAVAARELGVPCVVNTRTGTRCIRTGDRIRVDGHTGRVEVLERAATQTA